jgi:predicted RNA-binding Zn ribbon-like protein
MTAMWEWLEGVPAIDLTETVRDVRGETVDLLVSEEVLDSWLAAQGDRLPPAERDLAAWRELRGAIAAAFAAMLAGEEPPAAAVEHINARAAAAPVVARLRAGRREEVPVGTASALAVVAASAIDVLGTETRERLRFCAAPSCGMYYLATRADQRWCSDACGTRARVARHARRHRD